MNDKYSTLMNANKSAWMLRLWTVHQEWVAVERLKITLNDNTIPRCNFEEQHSKLLAISEQYVILECKTLEEAWSGQNMILACWEYLTFQLQLPNQTKGAEDESWNESFKIHLEAFIFIGCTHCLQPKNQKDNLEWKCVVCGKQRTLTYAKLYVKYDKKRKKRRTFISQTKYIGKCSTKKHDGGCKMCKNTFGHSVQTQNIHGKNQQVGNWG